ncbi:uracil-DNA glycosylase family protein [uncultured Brachyspira sp.]|uniref:uracil-DNA glycosylase family protein n=1 Tax=uncultured Brachyspira sp. TaxID=221953 RepID=UPI00260C15AE|nr:uracil-DNA glycosylase family protein [uncultured Brachyspira sp.]
MNIEKHLFEDTNFFPDGMKILILGTFPVPLYSNIEKFNKLSEIEKENAWYYSSKRSEFWKIIADSFDIDYKNTDFLINKNKKKKVFKENRVGIADVFSKCKRKNEDSARDTDLIIVEYNNILSGLVNDKNNSLELIIFTSRFTENNFFKILKNNNIDYDIKESRGDYSNLNNITENIIKAVRESYLIIDNSRKIKLATITLKISPIKGVSLYSTKKDLYKYYLHSI